MYISVVSISGYQFERIRWLAIQAHSKSAVLAHINYYVVYSRHSMYNSGKEIDKGVQDGENELIRFNDWLPVALLAFFSCCAEKVMERERNKKI